RQHVVRSLGHDLRGDVLLAASRVDGHDAVLQVEQLDQLRDRRDLVGLGVHGHLPQGQAVAGRPGADQVQRAQPLGAVEGPPQGLAIDGNDLAPRRRRLPNALEPLDQTALQGLRTDGLEDPPEGVVRRDPLGEFQEAPEEVFLLAAKGLQLDEVLAAAQYPAEAHDQDIHQGVAQVLALPPGIGDGRQRGHQVRLLLGLHRPSSLRPGSGSVCTDPAEHDQRKSLSDNRLKCARPGGEAPAADEPSPRRDELCSVPVGQARDFLETLAEKKRGAGYIWDHLDELWVKLDSKRLRPGLTILLPASVGGYDWDEGSRSGKGWDADSTNPVTPVPGESRPE